MFIIDEVVVEDDVRDAQFCCDLKQCKGACCCIEGGRGAPLEDDEILEIEKAYPYAKQYLRQQSIDAIETSGMYEGSPGNFATTCIDRRECAFVYFDDGIARCSFERAHEEGKTDWRKPISCHLFPVRIRKFGPDFVRYEQIDECNGGREFGATHDVQLHNFLNEPLIRKYGEPWYNKFLSRCRSKNQA